MNYILCTSSMWLSSKRKKNGYGWKNSSDKVVKWNSQSEFDLPKQRTEGRRVCNDEGSRNQAS